MKTHIVRIPRPLHTDPPPATRVSLSVATGGAPHSTSRPRAWDRLRLDMQRADAARVARLERW